jgi:hypothetical protein
MAEGVEGVAEADGEGAFDGKGAPDGAGVRDGTGDPSAGPLTHPATIATSSSTTAANESSLDRTTRLTSATRAMPPRAERGRHRVSRGLLPSLE